MCGVYAEEMSASTYIPKPCRDFPVPVSFRKKDPDFLKKKKYSLMIMKQSMMRVKSSKHEVYVVSDNDESRNSQLTAGERIHNQTETDKLISSRPRCEKIQSGSPIQETIKSEHRNHSDNQCTVNFQTSQSKLFVRNYMKSKTGSPRDLHFGSSDNVYDFHRRPASRPAQLEPKTLLTATAVKDCVPSPYDMEALAFRKGDIIKVTEMNVNGLWRGLCRGKKGTFKFIDVKTHDRSRGRFHEGQATFCHLK